VIKAIITGACLVLSAASAEAQLAGDAVAVPLSIEDAVVSERSVDSAPAAAAQVHLRQSIATAGTEAAAQLQRERPRGIAAMQGSRQRSAWRKLVGGAVGAVGGFFGGGYLGAKIEGNRCACDDPGLQGFLIGAPIGAVVGGVAGALFLF